MKYIYALILVFLFNTSALACSFGQNTTPNEIKERWEALSDKQRLANKDTGIPKPKVILKRVTRAVEAPGMSCNDAGTFSFEISLPNNSSSKVRDYYVVFRAVKGVLPDSIFPDFPLQGKLNQQRKIFFFAWLDGAPYRQKNIDADIEVFLVSKGLKIGPATRLNIKARKSSFSLDYHTTPLSFSILISTARNKNEEEYIRSAAAKRLSSFGIKYFMPYIVAILDDKSEPARLRSSIAEALGKNQLKGSYKALIRNIEDESPILRSAIISSLSKYKRPEISELILIFLKDKAPEVRAAAAIALSEKKNKKAVLPLISLLKDPSSEVRKAAIFALGPMKDARSFNPITKLVNDPDDYVRLTVISIIGEFNHPKTSHFLLNALDDKYFLVRNAAVYYLGKHKDKQTVSALIRRLQDEHQDVRLTAAIALGKIGSKVAVAALITALDDKETEVRRGAAETLGLIKEEEAIEPLIQALHRASRNKDAITGQAMLNALKAFDTPEAKEAAEIYRF